MNQHGNLKRLIKDLNIITYRAKLNAGRRKNIGVNAGSNPTIVISPSDVDLTRMLTFSNCSGSILAAYDFSLYDKGNNVENMFELIWQLLLALNAYGSDFAMPFIESFQWQVGSMAQAEESFLELDAQTEGWFTFLPLIVHFQISREDLNYNTRQK